MPPPLFRTARSAETPRAPAASAWSRARDLRHRPSIRRGRRRPPPDGRGTIRGTGFAPMIEPIPRAGTSVPLRAARPSVRDRLAVPDRLVEGCEHCSGRHGLHAEGRPHVEAAQAAREVGGELRECLGEQRISSRAGRERAALRRSGPPRDAGDRHAVADPPRSPRPDRGRERGEGGHASRLPGCSDIGLTTTRPGRHAEASARRPACQPRERGAARARPSARTEVTGKTPVVGAGRRDGSTRTGHGHSRRGRHHRSEVRSSPVNIARTNASYSRRSDAGTSGEPRRVMASTPPSTLGCGEKPQAGTRPSRENSNHGADWAVIMVPPPTPARLRATSHCVSRTA